MKYWNKSQSAFVLVYDGRRCCESGSVRQDAVLCGKSLFLNWKQKFIVCYYLDEQGSGKTRTNRLLHILDCDETFCSFLSQILYFFKQCSYDMCPWCFFYALFSNKFRLRASRDRIYFILFIIFLGQFMHSYILLFVLLKYIYSKMDTESMLR